MAFRFPGGRNFDCDLLGYGTIYLICEFLHNIGNHPRNYVVL